ncbi:MAG: hypothetical protein MZU95_12800 [Desulfomicrobium escambiense]|nr:hypothetical protein [Desulfomicrobium escambiense]
MDFQDKKIVVLGMGKTGIATARFLGSRGARVVVADEKQPELWDAQYGDIAHEKWLKIGDYTAGILSGADMVIPSPGDSALQRNTCGGRRQRKFLFSVKSNWLIAF